MSMAASEFMVIDREIAETRKQKRYAYRTEPRGLRHYGPEDAVRRYEYVVVADLPQDVNPFWGVRAGQVIYNVRCALDYLAWQLVIENTGAEPPEPRLVQFPIADHPDDLTKQRTPRETLALVSDDAQTFIRNVQPYNGGEYERLGWLRDISNFDKHRTPAIATYAVLDSTMNFGRPAGSEVEDLWLHRGPAVDGAEIAHFTLVMRGEPGGTVNAKGSFAYQEVFEEPAVVRGKPLLRTIDDIRLLVGRILREAHVLFRQPP